MQEPEYKVTWPEVKDTHSLLCSCDSCLDPWKSWCLAAPGGTVPPNQKCGEDRSSLGWSRVEEKPAHKMFTLLIPSGTKGLQTASCLCPTQQSSSCVSLRSSGQLGHVPLYLCFPSFPASLSSFPLTCCPKITLLQVEHWHKSFALGSEF